MKPINRNFINITWKRIINSNLFNNCTELAEKKIHDITVSWPHEVLNTLASFRDAICQTIRNARFIINRPSSDPRPFQYGCRKFFLTVQEIVRRSRIPENLFYNSIPIIHASKCAKTSIRGEKKQCASRYYCDITLKICIHNRVEILTRGLQSIFRNMYDYF